MDDEKKFFKELEGERKKKEKDQLTQEIKERIINRDEMILNKLLVNMNEGLAQKLQESYEDYKLVRDQAFKDKGAEFSLEDIEERIPDNLWYNIMYKWETSLKFKLPTEEEIIEIINKLEKSKK